MFEDFDFWKMLAGLGVFLFGMFMMEEAIRKLSGSAFKRMIRRYTDGRFRSMSTGLLATAVLQSSSALSLMVLAFVGAGIMTLENGIGVILGSNIGSTFTSWIVASVGFKIQIESFALPLVGVGGLGLVFANQSSGYAGASKLLAGFGFLFLGLAYMKESVDGFTAGFDASRMPDYGLAFYLLVGLVMTAIMHSSAATMAIVLTALNAKLFSFDEATVMVIGANVGTTMTILLGALGGSQIKKRVALSHFIFNAATGVVAFLLTPALVWLVLDFFALAANPVLGLALYHTLFNLLGVTIFLPIVNLLAALLTRLFPDKKREALTLFIKDSTAEVPEAAIASLREEALHLTKRILRFNLALLKIDEKLVFSLYDYSAPQHGEAAKTIEQRYQDLKLLQAEILTFAAHVQSREMSETESRAINQLLHGVRIVLHSAKTLKDVRHNFEDFEGSENIFLNDQYDNFRKRMVELYLGIDKTIASADENYRTKAILKLLKVINDHDHLFFKQATKAINSRAIEDLEVSTVILVNRAFVQSARQVLLALRELLLTVEEAARFDQVQEISDSLLENENRQGPAPSSAEA